MNVFISPSRASGTVCAPVSKSDLIRKLICASLAVGTSTVGGFYPSDDVLCAIGALRELGADASVKGDTVTVKGFDPKTVKNEKRLFAGESGSVLRFLIPICMLSEGEKTFSGSERLFSRPISVYEDIAKKKGIPFSLYESGLSVGGTLTGGEFSFSGNISSQFISGLLLALPLCEEDSVIRLIPPVSSKPYIDMTVSTLSEFGIFVDIISETEYRIKGGQKYLPANVTAEGDHSGAAFLDALGLLSGSVTVTGTSENSLQGDKIYKKHFETLSKSFAQIDLSDCPDLAPILFVVASLFHGGRFTGTERLRLKESDRVDSMAKELDKCGIKLKIENDTVTVGETVPHRPFVPLEGHNDHRVVMALSVLLTVIGGEIDGAEAVSKSFPDFFERLTELGIDVSLIG